METFKLGHFYIANTNFETQVTTTAENLQLVDFFAVIVLRRPHMTDEGVKYLRPANQKFNIYERKYLLSYNLCNGLETPHGSPQLVRPSSSNRSVPLNRILSAQHPSGHSLMFPASLRTLLEPQHNPKHTASVGTFFNIPSILEDAVSASTQS